ncbi:hypothetical protein CAPTEDRAFT_169190 [Capitella teleta]|uniref:HIG1 domain-containing protein n=1 Tax=Capitella teleta TaxID=283909 RepID=R7V5B2_CAPTE|nr:hypothetical protein CAPTEDRAFT_169190 [Capitella teleta]|eukprot:ELU13724.1 hypothetical protein CAPTEDRAFT_169190 [Capitella teleta]
MNLTNPLTDEDLDYIKQDNFSTKFFRKTKENPLVPLGLGVTVFALVYGSLQMKSGDVRKSQLMMRLRVGAQAFTLFSLLGGVYYQGWKERRAKAKANVSGIE